jgi:hypothetical protein
MKEKAMALLDRNIEQFISRKFLAWVTATAMCVAGSVGSDDWVAVTMAYIGTQALVDAAVKWKHGVSGSRSSSSEG